MLTLPQLLSVHQIPPMTDEHVIMQRIECEKRVWSTKSGQENAERHLYLSIRYRNKKCKPPWL